MNKENFKRNFVLLNVGYAYHNVDWSWKKAKTKMWNDEKTFPG